MDTANLTKSSTSSPHATPRAAAHRAARTDTEARNLAQRLRYDWRRWARPNQLPPPGDWTKWLVLAGRGFGKTRSGAEYVRSMIEAGRAGRVALVAPIASDARDVMVEGPAGIMAVSPPWFEPTYEPSKRRLTWPNGALAFTYSADEPKRLRGPEHDLSWADELAAWNYPETWDMLMMGLRAGRNPRAVITTTPRPIRIIRELLEDSHTVVTRGSTYENLGNLAPTFRDTILSKYEGTRLGRQELYAEVLDDVPGALWTRAMLESARGHQLGDLHRVVVAIDPAVTSGDDADETGIIVAAKAADGLYDVLADRSCRMSPDGWATRAITALDEFKADRIVAEVNNGGDLVEATIRTVRRNAPYRKVHASRGKRVRAEPIAALYEQSRVRHHGNLEHLEAQMLTFLPEGSDASPDRVDALVWALTELSSRPSPTAPQASHSTRSYA